MHPQQHPHGNATPASKSSANSRTSSNSSSASVNSLIAAHNNLTAGGSVLPHHPSSHSGNAPPQANSAPLYDLPPEETTDLEELEQFAKTFKQRRIKLGKRLSIRRKSLKVASLHFPFIVCRADLNLWRGL